jgi:aryl-alcohol dehydrogenase-like predicted oxidoreductase
MKTDYIDLWQVHAIETYKDVENRVTNEILEVMAEAKKSDKVRYVGFTRHAHPEVHLRMLKLSDNQLDYDACQMPVNIMDVNFQSFIKNVMPELLKKKIGILAMKTLAEGRVF